MVYRRFINAQGHGFMLSHVLKLFIVVEVQKCVYWKFSGGLSMDRRSVLFSLHPKDAVGYDFWRVDAADLVNILDLCNFAHQFTCCYVMALIQQCSLGWL